MNIQDYLTRIGLASDMPLQADLATLTLLHSSQMFHVPFENLDIHLGRKIEIDPVRFYNKIVKNRRGGFCHELNGLFYTFLKQIGFDARAIACRVANEEGMYESTPGHVAVWVVLEGKNYLADTGFGYGFVEPLEVVLGQEVTQNGDVHKIMRHDATYLKLMRRTEGEEGFLDKYIFRLEEKQLQDFKEVCEYQQTSPKSHFTQKRICTIPLERGRVTLSDLRLVLTKKGAKTYIPLRDEEEFEEKLREYFGIDLSLE